MRSLSGGFSMKSKAPSLVASTAVFTVPWPERITTGGRPVLRLEPLQDLHAVHLRHLDVEEDEVGVLLLGDLQARGAVGGEEHSYPSYSKIILSDGADALLVVDDQDPGLHFRFSTSTRVRNDPEGRGR